MAESESPFAEQFGEHDQLLAARAAEAAASAPRTAPSGFAAPDVAGLSAPLVPDSPAVPGPAPAPGTFVQPEKPGPSLDQLVPAPPTPRDPSQPFSDVGSQFDDDDAAGWDPRQPLVTYELDELEPPSGSSVDPALLPPPAGRPVGGRQPTQNVFPTPIPRGAYPPNPYATGPYSTPIPGRQLPPYPAMQHLVPQRLAPQPRPQPPAAPPVSQPPAPPRRAANLADPVQPPAGPPTSSPPTGR